MSAIIDLSIFQIWKNFSKTKNPQFSRLPQTRVGHFNFIHFPNIFNIITTKTTKMFIRGNTYNDDSEMKMENNVIREVSLAEDGQGTFGDAAGRYSMRNTGGKVLRMRSSVVQKTTAQPQPIADRKPSTTYCSTC